MLDDWEQQPSKYKDVLDAKTYNSITQLADKLKSLLVEIHAKKDSMPHTEDEESRHRQQQLATLSSEVMRALDAMEHLINMVMDDEDMMNELTIFHHEELDNLKKMFLDNAHKIEAVESKTP